LKNKFNGGEMMSQDDKLFDTSVVHDGYDAKGMLGSLSVPIFQTSTYAFETAEQGERRFSGKENGYIYTRLGNPTVSVLEERIAALEGGEKGLAFSSGMAAIASILIALTKTGDHIICSAGLYGGTFSLFNLLKEKYKIQFDISTMETREQIESLIRPETRCIYVETPINPTMKLIDLQMVAEVSSKHQLPVIVDNTFATPYLQRPLELGCDVVIHSATKYIGGHGDVIAGLVVGKAEFLNQVTMTTLKDIGGVLSPFDAWLLLRGLRTLPVRMEQHSQNAEKIFSLLKDHPKVAAVYYPGDPEAFQYEIFKKQMSLGGGMISFEIEGTKEDAQHFLNLLKLIKIAVSLGDTETLIEHPATMTHGLLSQEERDAVGIRDQLIRLSVGLEHWKDIWADLKQALDQL
jgi:methionine-gamma-lyase